jgi:hypothetical protein
VSIGKETMTKKTRNRLLALLLVVIPIGSYSYFVTSFISNQADANKQDSNTQHRRRIEQTQLIPAQIDPANQR